MNRNEDMEVMLEHMVWLVEHHPTPNPNAHTAEAVWERLTGTERGPFNAVWKATLKHIK